MGNKMLARHVCYPRKRFTTIESARAAANVIALRSKQARPVEPCSKCNGWHLAAPDARFSAR